MDFHVKKSDDMERCMLNDIQAAARLGVSPQTLRNHRCKGIGLPYTRFGRRVLYDPVDIEALISQNKIMPR